MPISSPEYQNSQLAALDIKSSNVSRPHLMLHFATCTLEPGWLLSMDSANEALNKAVSGLLVSSHSCMNRVRKVAENCGEDPFCSRHRECWGNVRGGGRAYKHPDNCGLGGQSNRYPRSYSDKCGVPWLAREHRQLSSAKAVLKSISFGQKSAAKPLQTVLKLDAILKVVRRVNNEVHLHKCAGCGQAIDSSYRNMFDGRLKSVTLAVEELQAEFWFFSVISSVLGSSPMLTTACNPKAGANVITSRMSAPEVLFQQGCEPSLPFQDIDHDEEPAVRDEALLQKQSEEDWASAVEFCNHGYSPKDQNEDQTAEEEIFLLKYNRAPEAFRMALLEGPELRQCRDALREHDLACVLESLAKIFVHPWQYEEVIKTLQVQKVELKNVHVIVASSLEHLVQIALEKIPSRQGVRLKNHSTMLSTGATPNPCGASSEILKAVLHGESEMLECVSRQPLSLVLKKRSPKSVTQSTTEAHVGQPGINPRRFRIFASMD